MSLADISTPWQTIPIKQIADLNPETLSEATDPEREFRYIDIGSVAAGQISGTELMTFQNAPSRARRVVRKGDVLVSTVRTYLRAVAGVPDQHEGSVASTGFAVLRPKVDRVDPRFLRYWCLSDPFVSEVVGRSVGVSYPAINASDVGRLLVPVPPLDFQDKIASYLDRENERIDGIILKNERVADLLAERWHVLLDGMVFGASRENFTPLHRLVRQGRPIIYGIVLPGPNVSDGVPLIKGGDVHAHRLASGVPSRVAHEIEAGKSRSRVATGDLVYAIRGSFGDVDVVPESLCGANITQDVARISPDPKRVQPEWLRYALLAPSTRDEAERMALGATISGVNIGDLRRFRVPVPDLGEQLRIVRRLDELWGATQALQQALAMQNDVLVERRQALITAAVVGDVDVEKAA